jgi:hypothetical protein
VSPQALAQGDLVNAPEPAHTLKEPVLPDRLPEKPSQPPAFKIAVEPLGFTAPGSIYMGQRNSAASLDFLDENRLLFSFRVPGLIRREAGEDEERQIRAVVVSLPSGKVEAEALWTVHGRARYLWMLNGGHFLLRDRESIEMGDGSLVLKPFLRFPGPLAWLETDPAGQFLVTDSREPVTADQPGEAAKGDMVVRILRRETGEVLLVSRGGSAVHLPINADGYLESLREMGTVWMLKLNRFSGGSANVGEVHSSCSPLFDFLSQRVVLASTCTAGGVGKLVAMETNGSTLWEAQTSEATIWPIVVRAPDGSRFAREALALTHAVKAGRSLSQEEIKGQFVEVLDAVDGRVVLETAASPILDGGGNVAISPSGRRVAVLNGGQLQVFELPAPPPLPAR